MKKLFSIILISLSIFGLSNLMQQSCAYSKQQEQFINKEVSVPITQIGDNNKKNETKNIPNGCRKCFELMGLEGNRYPFEKKWADKLSSKKQYQILFAKTDYGDISNNGIIWKTFKKNNKYFYVTEVELINTIHYKENCCDGFIAIFDTNWILTRLDTYEKREENKMYHTTYTFDKQGNITDKTEKLEQL